MHIRILSIGDICAVSAQRYLAKIAKCDSVRITCGVMSCDDADIKKHAEALVNDERVYTFDYCANGSVRVNTEENCSFSDVISMFDWDYITINQSIAKAGIKESYFPYINEICELFAQQCPRADIVLVEPWAFSKECNSEAFEIYNNDTERMVNMIRSCCISVAENTPLNIVFPVGEAWSLVRELYPELALTGDGIRSNRMGDFVCGALWYELLTGNSIVSNSYRLPFVNNENVEKLKVAVHKVSEKYSL